MSGSYERIPVIRKGQMGTGIHRTEPLPPIDDSRYLAALDDPDMVEIVAERHFMRRETWGRYKDLFPVAVERREATLAEKIRAAIAKKQAKAQAAREWRARKAMAQAHGTA